MKTIEMLIDEIKASEGMQKQLAEAAKNNAIADFLKEQGCEVTAEEFITAIKEQTAELDDDELDGVAGGVNGGDGVLSVFKPGFGCLGLIVASIDGSGVSTDSDGRVLCNDL